MRMDLFIWESVNLSSSLYSAMLLLLLSDVAQLLLVVSCESRPDGSSEAPVHNAGL